MTAPADLEDDDYDEFQFLQGHAEWAGLAWTARPAVTRGHFAVGADQNVSYLRWGKGEPELVLLHGAGQNAHTWDTFAMALDRPALAIDLPGHGRSDWRSDRDYTPARNREAVAAVVESLAPSARGFVGMSLGGLTTLSLSRARPELVRGAVIVDITPRLPEAQGRGAPGAARQVTPMQLMGGPRTFDSFAAILDATAAVMPHRTRESLIPGLRHNSKRHDDGRWGWRYDELFREGDRRPDFHHLWDDISALAVPALFVKGANSPMVGDEAIAELQRRQPAARLEVVADAGHAVQNDRPVELARLVESFYFLP
jgi:pimeloyl-ACP methyl ester carboxylesterase